MILDQIQLQHKGEPKISDGSEWRRAETRSAACFRKDLEQQEEIRAVCRECVSKKCQFLFPQLPNEECQLERKTYGDMTASPEDDEKREEVTTPVSESVPTLSG